MIAIISVLLMFQVALVKFPSYTKVKERFAFNNTKQTGFLTMYIAI